MIGKRRSVRDEAERHWDYLRSIWKELREQLPSQPQAPADPTGIAINQWLEPLFNELGYGHLTANGSLGLSSDDQSKTFPVSHRWDHVPIHLAVWNAPLDTRSAPGTVPAQSMVQECLNRSSTHLWAVLSNGRQIRLLRDSSALATASYVEFDLEAIFDGELFSEFVLLYRLLHVSRFELAPGTPPSSCRLETWRVEAIDSGTRALDQQRDGVEKAIRALGTGFVRHPANAALRQNIDAHDLHRSLLRLVYRMIFLFVAEDRNLLHPNDADELAKQRYAKYFSGAHLRQVARKRRGTTHHDLYSTLHLVLTSLANDNGRPELGLVGLGGLFDLADSDPLHGAQLANEYLLDAVRHLDRAYDPNAARWRQIDYRNMGAEELGSIYESLLELVPKHSDTDQTFELENRAGNDRKQTGSYYTPTSLIEVLLDSSLNPVIDDAVKRGEETATGPDATDSIVTELLSLTVCDPACGSGHFLVAASRRIAKRVAAVREGNPEPTIESVRHALHEVIARCIYGVDLEPMAVELAKVSLWLEAMEPGKPLGFLDAHIKHGNSLIGTTPELMAEGVPARAFKLIEGDDKDIVRSLADRNELERTPQETLFDRPTQPKISTAELAREMLEITAAPADALTDVRRQTKAYEQLLTSSRYMTARRRADAWCAAFVWEKTKGAGKFAVTQETFLSLNKPDGEIQRETHQEIIRLRDLYRFFHWHIEFPNIFPDDEPGGFDCVLGNPPWDKIDFEDKKYFSIVEPRIAAMAGAKRRAEIQNWMNEHPEAGERYNQARRRVKGSFHFMGSSGSYPSMAKGLSIKGVNSLLVDQLFAELTSYLIAGRGRAGVIVPTAIGTGAGAQHLFGKLSSSGRIASLFDFENRRSRLSRGEARLFFPGVDSRIKFCLLSLTGAEVTEPETRLASFLGDTMELEDRSKVFTLTPDEITLINPNSGTLPVFRNRRDADLTTFVYRRLPVLWNERKPRGNSWKISFTRLFDMTDDSDIFQTQVELEAAGWALEGNIFVKGNERKLPLYEAKMVDFFNHRAADVIRSETALNRQNQPRYLQQTDLRNPSRFAFSLNWVHENGAIKVRRRDRDVKVDGVRESLRKLSWEREWLCGWCDVTSSTNERTSIPAFLPISAVGHTFPVMLPKTSPRQTAGLIAVQSSLVFDFISRQKIGGIHMALMTWKQLPVPTPKMLDPHLDFIVPRVLELTYTAHDMAGLAADLDDTGQPFIWDDDRRAHIRAELDALFFYLYGISRDDAEYIMGTFRTDTGGLMNNEIKAHGTYRTRDLVLAAYNRMAPAKPELDRPLSQSCYVSELVPPPGQGPRHS